MRRWVYFLFVVMLLSPAVSAQEPTTKHERFERRVHSAAEPLIEAEKPTSLEEVVAEPTDEGGLPTELGTRE